MAILEGGHIVPPLHSSYIQKLHAIRVKKVKVLLIFYGPLPPTFYLVKLKLLALHPSPQSQQKLHSERSFNYNSLPYWMWYMW